MSYDFVLRRDVKLNCVVAQKSMIHGPSSLSNLVPELHGLTVDPLIDVECRQYCNLYE